MGWNHQPAMYIHADLLFAYLYIHWMNMHQHMGILWRAEHPFSKGLYELKFILELFNFVFFLKYVSWFVFVYEYIDNRNNYVSLIYLF